MKAVEKHLLNPYVRLGTDGVWGSGELPVEDWEEPFARVVLMPEMQILLDFQKPILRWSRQKYLEVLNNHTRDSDVILDLSNQLLGWRYLGKERTNLQMRRVILLSNDGRWYSVTMGSLLGSENIVTVTGSRRSGFLTNRLKGMTEIVSRDRE